MRTIRIWNVPDDLRRALEGRAALAGQSLSEFVLELLRRQAAHPTPQDLRAILAGREPVEIDRSAADIIREARGPLGRA